VWFGGGGSGSGYCSSSPEDEVSLLDSLPGLFGMSSGGAGCVGAGRGGRGSGEACSGRGGRSTVRTGWLLMACTMLVTTDDGNVLRPCPLLKNQTFRRSELDFTNCPSCTGVGFKTHSPGQSTSWTKRL
jgi:hypothetical protein